jgi:hypothetical protein
MVTPLAKAAVGVVNTDAADKARAKEARVMVADMVMVKVARARVKATDMDKVAKANVAREAAGAKVAMAIKARAKVVGTVATVAMATSNAATIKGRGTSPALLLIWLLRHCQAWTCRAKNRSWHRPRPT